MSIKNKSLQFNLFNNEIVNTEKIPNKEALLYILDLLIPIGTVQAYSGNSINSPHFMFCDGREISRSKYSRLFNIIGTNYGVGDGVDTFNLPNLVGRFLECTDDINVIGKYKEAGLPNITGYAQIDGTDSSSYPVSGALYNYGTFSGAGQYHHSSQTVGAIGFDASKSNEIYGNSSTVQPASLTLLPCIKY
jgi:hypothetical protein